ncbi:hypothetical protein Val02_45500 [Virgisporangium aliadipatigenens]|uniref:HTH gntR-type domain-containing protein n=1 Tax=Virgisporangium aliadipatigenens TaxID=741659 RepID=A0A8J4DRH2_9ACTN|nr:winged helix-turn-helix domain-containing protein [Virgisporangium aliadipatigenens]GIJ47664.1 hypothetical protein Val02_45500 [Virgisporangium aliadipatigenens]
MPPRPTHRQRVFDDIRTRIASGELAPGAKLPSLAELRDLYGVSDQPIKRALDDLKLLGYVEGQQGVGVYVADSPPGG